MMDNAIYHVLSWISHKAKSPVKSVPAAEILSATEGIDEGKTFAQAYSEIMGMDIKNSTVCRIQRSAHLYLSTQRDFAYRSICGYISCIRFDQERQSTNLNTTSVSIYWETPSS